MAAEYITKESKKKDGSISGTKYRIDADFKPKIIGEITQEFIENYCEANNQGEWLLSILDKTDKRKDGKEIPISFMSVRKEFALKFFPKIIKGKKKEPTWAERMKEKFG